MGWQHCRLDRQNSGRVYNNSKRQEKLEKADVFCRLWPTAVKMEWRQRRDFTVSIICVFEFPDCRSTNQQRSLERTGRFGRGRPLLSIGGRRVDLSLFPRRQLVYLGLRRQFRSNVNVDDIWPTYIGTIKLWTIWEQNSMFTDDFCWLPSVAEQMNQRPVNTKTCWYGLSEISWNRKKIQTYVKEWM